MKKIKFLTVLALCMIFMVSTKQPIQASLGVATPIEISPRYINIASTTTALSNISGKASCTASITAYSSSSNLKVFLYLQKYVGGTWTPAGSWTSSKTGSSLLLTKNVSVGSGKYRVMASYHCNGENTVQYSAEKTF